MVVIPQQLEVGKKSNIRVEKSAKPPNVMYLIDRLVLPIAMSEPVASGNQNDLYHLVVQFEEVSYSKASRITRRRPI